MKTKKRVSSKRPSKSAQADLKRINEFNSGDMDQFPELLKSYTNLINTITEKYRNQGLTNEELVLFGKIGLLKAAHRFDENKPVHFRTYAIWWIRQSITKALNEQSTIDQVPEALIINLVEILESFQSGSPKTACEIKYNEIETIVDNKIQELLKQKAR